MIALDLSGQQPSRNAHFVGVLTEDAEVVDLDGEQTFKLVAQCGEVFVVACVRNNPVATDRGKKGMMVVLNGIFTPTSWDGDKLVGGLMLIDEGAPVGTTH
jgi:hypothetical protein